MTQDSRTRIQESKMSIIEKLASSLGRRDEEPNIALAKQIADKNDRQAVKELVSLLGSKNKDIQSDSIKVLYETGERKPALVAGYVKEFAALLGSRNNRLQWGAMTALNAIVPEDPKAVYSFMVEIMTAADQGSVITRDQAVKILTRLCGLKPYADKAFPLLLEQLLSCPTNQLPMYAENALPVINSKNKAPFIKALTSRLDEIEKDSKRKRVEKVIRGLGA